jgi:hypothetical protein
MDDPRRQLRSVRWQFVGQRDVSSPDVIALMDGIS